MATASRVGNTGITSADTLTVKGTGGLSNTGNINIEGSAGVRDGEAGRDQRRDQQRGHDFPQTASAI